MFESQANPLKKMICSIVGGIIYGLGFWILVDAIAYTRKFLDDKSYVQFKWHWFLPFILSTFSILTMNCFTAEDFRGQGISDVNMKRARLCFVMSILAVMVAFGVSLVIAVEHYFQVKDVHDYPGIALLVSNITCIFASVVVRFGHW
eukprot:UN01871